MKIIIVVSSSKVNKIYTFLQPIITKKIKLKVFEFSNKFYKDFEELFSNGIILIAKSSGNSG